MSSQAPMMSASPDGSIRFRFSERLTEVANTRATELVQSKDFNPGSSGCARLDTFAKAFDRYRINSVIVRYLPSVGLTSDGAITFGIDWDWKGSNTSSWVLNLYPKTRTPVWKQASLVVPRTIMPSQWLRTSLPADTAQLGTSFAVGILIPGVIKSFGEIWLDYDVTFQGSKAASEN